MKHNHATGKASVLLALLACSLPVVAQPGFEAFPGGEEAGRFQADGSSWRPPAVSEFNGKISYAGGNMNSAEGHNLDGSITFPISQHFGFQVDGLYSRIDNQDFYGGAGHLFWRNPEVGLIGLTGGYLNRSGVDTFQVGAEGEYYFGRFTFGLFAGVASIRRDHSAPFINTNPTRFIGGISADYYPLDDLRLGIAHVTAFGNSLIKGEVEYQTPIRGLALTGEAAAGDHGYDHWLLGVRYYFGGNKSLRDRQRRDDPRGLMPQILHSLGLHGAEFNRKGKAYLASHPGAGRWEGSGSYGLNDVLVNGSDWPVEWPVGWPVEW